MNELKISDFYKVEYVNFATYDCYRKLGCFVDGFKISMRKITYTLNSNYKNTDKIKVSQLSAKTAETTQYLHGENSLQGVMVNMAQNFTGTNNLNLLNPEGAFGTRLIQEAAAPRYIYTQKNNLFDKIFIKDDEQILTGLIFEGDTIEYKYYLPIIPMLLVNGSEGMAVGFAQKILNRNPKEIIKVLKNYIKTKQLPTEIIPWYKGFAGTITKNSENQIICTGKIEKINTSKLRITEIPFNYDLTSYLKILNDLEEKGKIKNYKDLSESNNFEFEISMRREDLEKLSQDDLLNLFKLISRTTENFTCLDENSKIKQLNSEIEILENFIRVRTEAYHLRKKVKCEKALAEIKVLKNKYKYIANVVKGNIVIFKEKKENILKKIEELALDKINDSYDYLLAIRVGAFTEDELIELKESINQKIIAYNEYLQKNIETIWYEELDDLEKNLKNYK